VAAGVMALLVYRFHFQLAWHWPFIIPPVPVKH
jgi:hypothetical protein